MSAAETIFKQLGGGRFKVMTGARDFVSSERGLAFRLPARFAADGINAVRVTLTAADLYDMEFLKMATPSLRSPRFLDGPTLTTVKKFEGIFNDQLQPLFSKTTGLDTHL